MVKIYYVGILRNMRTKPIVQLAAEYDFSAFNQLKAESYRGGAKTFAERIAERTPPGAVQVINLEKEEPPLPLLVHAYAHNNGICGIVITDKDYPDRVSASLLKKINDEFVSRYPRSTYENLTAPPPPSSSPFSYFKQAPSEPQLLPYPELKDYIKQYQDPEQVDNILKIQRELDETMEILHKTMASVLDRGEKIDDLVAKSAHLNTMSKAFFVQSKKQNSCCVVM